MGILHNSDESGKVFVKGKASEKFTCDKVTITLTFYCKAIFGAKASETVMAQCEKFLQRLAESGVDISAIRLHNDNINYPSYRNEEMFLHHESLNLTVTQM